jgi:hypothetical protein
VTEPARDDRGDLAADRAAVHEVLVRYALGLDRRDYALVTSCFDPDALCEYDGEPVRGHAELLPYLQQRLNPLLSTHHYITNVVIKIDGNRATAGCYAIAALLRDTGTGVEAMLRGLRYADVLRRDGAGWVITERRHLPQWMVVLPAEQLNKPEGAPG